MAATSRSTAFKIVQLLASLTSIATCLLVVARTGPQAGGGWPILAGSSVRRLVTSASGWTATGAADGRPLGADVARAAGVEPNPLDVAAAAVAAAAGHSLQDCLDAAREGHWRRVFNTS